MQRLWVGICHSHCGYLQLLFKVFCYLSVVIVYIYIRFNHVLFAILIMFRPPFYMLLNFFICFPQSEIITITYQDFVFINVIHSIYSHLTIGVRQGGILTILPFIKPSVFIWWVPYTHIYTGTSFYWLLFLNKLKISLYM